MVLLQHLKPLCGLTTRYLLCMEMKIHPVVSTTRSFSKSSQCNLKEIHINTEENVTTIEGVYKESDRKGKVINIEDPPGRKLCPVCPIKLKTDIQHTDVLILSQFLKPTGELLPRSITGVCGKAQNKLSYLVERAQRAGLMPEFPHIRDDIREKETLKKTFKWRKYNVYFEEDGSRFYPRRRKYQPPKENVEL